MVKLTLEALMNTAIADNVITKKGTVSGKTVAVLAGIHGNEKAGVTALHKAISSLQITGGIVHFIIGNPRALAENVRFTEMNLNRAFIRGPLKYPELETTYERERAKELMPLLDTCDALLDLHTVKNPKTVPFIISESAYFPIAEKFPLPIISSGWNSIEPGSTDYYMSTNSKPALCLECGYHEDPVAITRAENGIRIFLQIMGNIEASLPLPTYTQKRIDAIDVYLTKQSFTRCRDFSDFETVSKDELVGKDASHEFRMPYDGIIIFARDVDKPNIEAVIIGKEEK